MCLLLRFIASGACRTNWYHQRSFCFPAKLNCCYRKIFSIAIYPNYFLPACVQFLTELKKENLVRMSERKVADNHPSAWHKGGPSKPIQSIKLCADWFTQERIAQFSWTLLMIFRILKWIMRIIIWFMKSDSLKGL